MLATTYGPLEKPRHWLHYLYAADEPAARAAADLVVAGSWGVQRIDQAAQGSTWLVLAEKHDAVLNAATVKEARVFFEAVAASVPGGDDDGWEASG